MIFITKKKKKTCPQVENPKIIGETRNVNTLYENICHKDSPWHLACSVNTASDSTLRERSIVQGM